MKVIVQTKQRMPPRQKIVIGEIMKMSAIIKLLKDGNKNVATKTKVNLVNKTYYSVLPVLKSKCI